MHDPIQVIAFAEIFLGKNISIEEIKKNKKELIDKGALEKPFKHHKFFFIFKVISPAIQKK